MATQYGLTDLGFVAKTMEVIVDDLNALFYARFGFAPRGAIKKFIEILAECFTELWELGEISFTAMDPDAVLDALQDALNSITGTIRKPATYSTVTITPCGTPTTLLDAGKQAKTLTGDVYATNVAATITAVPAWVAVTGYTVGNRVTNAAHVYQCTTSGTSAGSGGPTVTDPLVDIVDGTAHWLYIGEGTGAIDVAATCTVTGPRLAVAGEINIIVDSTGGWDTVRNLTDAVPGTDIESNEDYRVRREEELSQAGATTDDAIRAQLLEITGVSSVTVFINNGDTIDVDGMLPHSVECLVRGGADQDIYNELLATCIAAGIDTVGTNTGTATDSAGNAHTVKFSRPDEVLIYERVSLEKDPTVYPIDGTAQIQAKTIAYGDAQLCGKNAVASSVGAQAFIKGVNDVKETLLYTDVIAAPTAWAPTTAYVATVGGRSVVTNDGRSYICITAGTSAGSGGPLGTGTNITDGTAHWYYLGTTIAISTRQLAVFDTSRITVITTDGTP